MYELRLRERHSNFSMKEKSRGKEQDNCGMEVTVGYGVRIGTTALRVLPCSPVNATLLYLQQVFPRPPVLHQRASYQTPSSTVDTKNQTLAYKVLCTDLGVG